MDTSSWDWPLFISACALIISLWNAFEHWKDKQPSLFISDVNVEIFTNNNTRKAFVRLDLILNVLSSQPIPVSCASVSMGKAQPCPCSHRSPTPHTLDYCTEPALDRSRKLDDFFGPSVRFPTTLPPSSAQHICLWLSLPAESELLNNLLAASCAPIECQAESSTARRSHSSPASNHPEACADDIRRLRERTLVVYFQSGNRTLAASALISTRNCVFLPE